MHMRARATTRLKRHDQEFDIMAVFLGDQPLHPHLAAEVTAWCRILRRGTVDREDVHQLCSFAAKSSFCVKSGNQRDSSRRPAISSLEITPTIVIPAETFQYGLRLLNGEVCELIRRDCTEIPP